MSVTSLSGPPRSCRSTPPAPTAATILRPLPPSAPTAHLVPGDTDDAEDIFIRDLTTSTTTLITPAASGINGSRSPVFSPDGARVLFISDADNLVPNDANGWGDIFLYDLATATSLVSLNAAGTTSADDVSGEPRFDPTGSMPSRRRRPGVAEQLEEPDAVSS
jgi:hypothetical protein